MKRLLALVFLVVFGVVLWPTAASAHPLGNFSVNQAVALTLSPSSVAAHVSIDFAELPTLAAKPAADLSGRTVCLSFASSFSGLSLVLDGSSFAYEPGSSGLSTSRVVCSFHAGASLRAGSVVSVGNGYLSDRVGWREFTASGSGLELSSALPAASPSGDLRSYPSDLLASPMDVRSATIRVVGLSSSGTSSASSGSGASSPSSGGSSVGPSGSLPGSSGSLPGSTGSLPGSGGSTAGSGVSLPGTGGWTAGFERRLSALVGSRDLTPLAGLLAVLLSLVLGAAHAALPGHGKTVMAAYMAGRDGRPRDALAVGATVTLTHTGGVLLLGLALTGIASLAGERVLGALGVASGVLIAAVGVYLFARAFATRASAVPSAALSGGGEHVHAVWYAGDKHHHTESPAVPDQTAHGPDDHDHPHTHGASAGVHEHDHPHAHTHDGSAGVHEHDHPHAHDDSPMLAGHEHDHTHGASAPGHEHDHRHAAGGLREASVLDHSHERDARAAVAGHHHPHLADGDPAEADAHDGSHAHGVSHGIDGHGRSRTHHGAHAHVDGRLGSSRVAGAIRHSRSEGAEGAGHAHRHGFFGHTHSHGPDGHGHSHGPAPRSRRDRLGMIALGIAGGLVPSPTALLVLLGAIAFGRTAFGVALVLAYGLGMAATLTAAGLLLVRVRHSVLDRPVFARIRGALPLTTSGLILIVGLGMALRAGAAFV